jgi:hypothetical protein
VLVMEGGWLEGPVGEVGKGLGNGWGGVLEAIGEERREGGR